MFKPLVAVIFLSSCSSEGNKKSESIGQVSTEKKSSLFQTLKETKNASKYINTKDWATYESMGDPDTSLVLFGYRSALSMDTTFYPDLEGYIRLYKENFKINKLFPQIFPKDTTIETKIKNIAILKTHFLTFAKKEMDNDIKKYGQSDTNGILFEFIQDLNIKK